MSASEREPIVLTDPDPGRSPEQEAAWVEIRDAVRGFDGYRRFGGIEGIRRLHDRVAERFRCGDGGSLEPDEIRGALFSAARAAKFTGGYPSGPQIDEMTRWLRTLTPLR